MWQRDEMNMETLIRERRIRDRRENLAIAIDEYRRALYREERRKSQRRAIENAKISHWIGRFDQARKEQSICHA